MDNRDLYSGMIRLHRFHHAETELSLERPMAEELARHRYKISPGTLYPILHGLERRGYLEPRRSGPAEVPSVSTRSQLRAAVR